MIGIKYTKIYLFEKAIKNPTFIARRIIKANGDDVSTYNLITECKEYLSRTGERESLYCFNEELKEFGWGI